MKQKKTGYIALAAVGFVVITVIVVMVVGNHSGEKQDTVRSTGVITEKKEDLPAAPIETEDDEENTGQKADSTANEDDGTKKESTANQDNGTKKDSSANKDNGKDTSDKKDKAEDDEVTDSLGKQNASSTDRSSDSPADSGDADKNFAKGTDSIELPFVPAK